MKRTLSLFAVLGLLGVSASAQPQRQQTGIEPPYYKPGEQMRLECESYCSPFHPGVNGVRLTLSGPWTFAAKQIRVDWTTHKDGFETGAFQSFAELVKGQRPTSSFATAPGALSEAAAALQLFDVQETVLALERLEPGIYYRWRVMIGDGKDWKSGPSTACTASICPFDPVEEMDPTKKYDPKQQEGLR